MRLGEIKNTIDNTLTEDKVLFIDYEPVFGNQAYIVKNYKLLMDTIKILYDQRRNDADEQLINGITDEFDLDKEVIQLSADQFNKLNQYISTINTKMPLYYSILETMVSKQDETMINIKLPNMKIESLSDLNDFNKRVDKILKSFSIDGGYQFKGLDKGSERYEILINGVNTYNIFIACLDVAQKCISIYKDYYDSKKAEKDYKASLDKENLFTKQGLERYTQARLDIELEEKIQELLSSVKTDNGKSEIELQTQLIHATNSLIKELGEGTEFHLSLNPPEYAKELGGSLVIDYKKLASLSDTSNIVNLNRITTV